MCEREPFVGLAPSGQRVKLGACRGRTLRRHQLAERLDRVALRREPPPVAGELGRSLAQHADERLANASAPSATGSARRRARRGPPPLAGWRLRAGRTRAPRSASAGCLLPAAAEQPRSRRVRRRRAGPRRSRALPRAGPWVAAAPGRRRPARASRRAAGPTLAGAPPRAGSAGRCGWARRRSSPRRSRAAPLERLHGCDRRHVHHVGHVPQPRRRAQLARRRQVGLAGHPRLAGCFQQPALEGPQRARAAHPACAVELVAEAGLEVVGVVDHRALARQAAQRGRGHRAVGDHPPAGGCAREAGGLRGQLGGDAARQGGGHAAQTGRHHRPAAGARRARARPRAARSLRSRGTPRRARRPRSARRADPVRRGRRAPGRPRRCAARGLSPARGCG